MSTATTIAFGLLTSVGVTAVLPSNSSALSILATRRIISSKMEQFTSSTHRVPARSIGPLFICWLWRPLILLFAPAGSMEWRRLRMMSDFRERAYSNLRQLCGSIRNQMTFGHYWLPMSSWMSRPKKRLIGAVWSVYRNISIVNITSFRYINSN